MDNKMIESNKNINSNSDIENCIIKSNITESDTIESNITKNIITENNNYKDNTITDELLTVNAPNHNHDYDDVFKSMKCNNTSLFIPVINESFVVVKHFCNTFDC